MIKYKLATAALAVSMAFGTIGCKDQLDVGNPNSPAATPASEAAILQLATGGVFINGFLNGDGWLGNSYFSLPMGYNELLADNVGASASNNQVTTIAQPEYIILDDGTQRNNTSATTGIIRTYNTRASTGGGNNALHYQWLNMYSMNSAMNLTLSIVEDIPYALDGPEKIKAIQAWCYFWKGYAYSSVGTKYIAGLIINEYVLSAAGSPETNNQYVSHDAMIAEGNKYYDLAATTAAATDPGVFEAIWGSLIPAQNLSGRGELTSADALQKNINTLKARNLMNNKLAPFVNSTFGGSITGSSMSGTMSDADWDTILDLTANGIGPDDPIFTGRTTGANDFFTAGGGTVNSLTANPARTSTFKPSERSIQYFRPGDERLARNFYKLEAGDDPEDDDAYSNDYVYGTRYTLRDFDLGESPSGDAWIYADKGVGAFELVIASSWEESALMRAEALIRKGGAANVIEAQGLIDAVREFMGADLDVIDADLLTVGIQALSEEAAMDELVSEKRVSMLYRGVTFNDHRRWGWTYDIANGGGSYHNTVVVGDEIIIDVTINYDFMDYWDVPANEIVLNPADGGSAPVVNPNF